jgi:DNA processing protein
VLASWKGPGTAQIRELISSAGPGDALETLSRDYPGGCPSPGSLDALRSCMLRNGISIVPYGSPGYPALLSATPDPPAMLFVRGAAGCLTGGRNVAVIGSRRSSLYGRRVARSISRELASAGVTVVSGLARGIDSEAHEGALDAGGETAAVLGSGVDVIYPPEHTKLARRVEAAGALVSEYVPGTRPERFNFPARNRIISGLSLGVVVVEAGERSGTMITVGTALDQGREVFAVPGEITRTTSTGTNRLLKEGAVLVTSADDVLETLGLQGVRSSGRALPAVEGELAGAVIRLLSGEPMNFDLMVRRLGVDTASLQSELLVLEMQGHVVRRPGELYTLS